MNESFMDRFIKDVGEEIVATSPPKPVPAIRDASGHKDYLKAAKLFREAARGAYALLEEARKLSPGSSPMSPPLFESYAAAMQAKYRQVLDELSEYEDRQRTLKQAKALQREELKHK